MANLSWLGHYVESIAPGGTSVFLSLISAGQNGAAETEAQVISAAGTYSRSSLFIQANSSATATLKFRVNGADGNQVVSVSSGLTGWFQDTTHSDTVSSGDNVNWKLTTTSGLTVAGVVSCQFDCSGSNPVSYHGQGCDTMSNDFTSGDEFHFTSGQSGQPLATDAKAKTTWRAAGTFSNLSILPNSGGQQPAVNLSLNGSSGNLAITAVGLGGRVTDTTHSDTVASGDTVSFKTNLAGKRWLQLYFRFTSSSTKFEIIGGDPVGSVGQPTFYHPIFGGVQSQVSTEARVQATAPCAVNLSKLRLNVSLNAALSGTQTYTLRKNGADGNQTISVASGTTGQFEDTSNTDSIAQGDLVNLKSVGTQSSGALVVQTALLADGATVSTETGTIDLELFGISIDATGDEQEDGTIDLELSGISIDAAGFTQEQGSGDLELPGIQIAGSLLKIDETGDIDLELGLIEIAGAGGPLTPAGMGLRQFWTFGI